MHYLMNGVGVYDEGTGELVGAEVVAKDKAFRGVLRVLHESIGDDSNHTTMVSAKKTLRALLLLTLVNVADALSLESPMSFSWLQYVNFHGLSLRVFLLAILFCICVAAVAMMPYVEEPEPEAEVDTTAESSTRAMVYNEIAVYGFLCVCVKHSLHLINEAEFDEDHVKLGSLNAIYEVLIDAYTRFEQDGISSVNLQLMMEMHNALQCHDSDFNGFERITVEPETGFTSNVEEPEVESMLPPDPPADFALAAPAAAFEPHSPEHMALWMIRRLTERLDRAIRSGRAASTLKYVEQHEIMVQICKFCREQPERRPGVWAMMQDLTDLSSSDEET